MPYTVLPASDRFWQVGVTDIYAVATIADAGLVPTRAEINASTTYVLQGEVATIEGFDTTPAQIDTPDAGSRRMSKIPGRINPSDSSMTFYASQDGVDVRSIALFDPDSVLYLVFCPGGDAEGYLADIFKVKVADRQFTHTTDETAGLIRVTFSLLNWTRDAALPAVA